MKTIIVLVVAILFAPLSYAHSRYDRDYYGSHRHYDAPNVRYYAPPPPVRYYSRPPVRYYAPPPVYFAPPAVVYPAPPRPNYRGYGHW